MATPTPPPKPGQRIPVTEGMIAEARKRTDYIVTKKRAGLALHKIAANTKLPVGAVEAVLREQGELPLPGSPPSSPLPPPAPEAAPVPPPQVHAPPPSPPSPVGPRTEPSSGLGNTGGAPAAPAPGATPTPLRPQQAPINPDDGYSPAKGYGGPAYPETIAAPTQGVSFGGGEIAGAAVPSPLSGAFEIPDLYLTLNSILIENGLTPRFALGIVRQFRHYPPQEYQALERLLAMGGVNPQARNLITNSYRLETKDLNFPEGEESESAGTTSQRVDQAIKAAGVGKGGDTDIDSEIAKIQKETEMIKLEEAKLALMERRKALGLTPGTGSGGDEMMDIMVVINGVPVPRRIKPSELYLWAPYMGKPNPQGAETDPKYAALESQLREERGRREGEEKARDEAWRKSMDDRLATLAAGGGQSQERNAEITALRAEMQKDRDERSKEERDRLARELRESRDALLRVQSPDFATSVLDAQRAGARKLGMVDKSEVGLLNEDQIQLEAQRKAAIRKDEAQGDLLKLGTEAIRDRPKIVKELVDHGAPDMLMKTAKGLLSVPGEEGASPVAPTEEELAASAASLERSARARGEAASAEGGSIEQR